MERLDITLSIDLKSPNTIVFKCDIHSECGLQDSRISSIVYDHFINVINDKKHHLLFERGIYHLQTPPQKDG